MRLDRVESLGMAGPRHGQDHHVAGLGRIRVGRAARCRSTRGRRKRARGRVRLVGTARADDDGIARRGPAPGQAAAQRSRTADDGQRGFSVHDALRFLVGWVERSEDPTCANGEWRMANRDWSRSIRYSPFAIRPTRLGLPPAFAGVDPTYSFISGRGTTETPAFSRASRTPRATA